nr:hypothetical protein [Polynucleobacter necessarius]
MNEVVIPSSVLNHLQQGLTGERPETLKDSDLIGANVANHVMATAYKSLEAAQIMFALKAMIPLFWATLLLERHKRLDLSKPG